MKAELAKAAKETGMEKHEPLRVGAMLAAIIEKGVSAESVAVVGELIKLQNQIEDKEAEKAFAAAFVALQGEMPKVQATKAVPNKDGTVRYKFAPYDGIMKQVAPILQAHGFTITFSTDYQVGPPQRLVQHCTLQHIGGHKRTNSFAVRIGNGPPGASETQADGAANTYAKRYALINALNITVAGIDDDAKAEGAEITEAQARRLEERCEQLGVEKAKFLKFAQATSFETIHESMHETLVQMLNKKADQKVPI